MSMATIVLESTTSAPRQLGELDIRGSKWLILELPDGRRYGVRFTVNTELVVWVEGTAERLAITEQLKHELKAIALLEDEDPPGS